MTSNWGVGRMSTNNTSKASTWHQAEEFLEGCQQTTRPRPARDIKLRKDVNKQHVQGQRVTSSWGVLGRMSTNNTSKASTWHQTEGCQQTTRPRPARDIKLGSFWKDVNKQHVQGQHVTTEDSLEGWENVNKQPVQGQEGASLDSKRVGKH